MRLLIYLLAMMTGFSAAEAARPVSATPATLGSAVAQAAVVAASIASVRDEADNVATVEVPVLSTAALAPVSKELVLELISPVKRHDITRQ